MSERSILERDDQAGFELAHSQRWPTKMYSQYTGIHRFDKNDKGVYLNSAVQCDYMVWCDALKYERSK